ncbi:hypothetical protein V502_07264 [Pseudogymnoascus sp. VKM F-4520 (FW-2644)]|nr:hypothetical protein V502_07264 [Pseudogymnoascus sp. VKM F-4520 (FW-2644)]
MSNQTVGTVYQQIIRDVVDSSRVDFEEGGVDESVLDELSRVWQQKLTALSVAQFPWDPKPEAPPPQQTMANIPSSMSYPQEPTPAPMHQQHAPPQQGQYMNRPGQQQAQAQAPQFPQMPQMPQMNAGPRIKAEPGLETGGMPPVYTGMGNATTAQQRAALNLQASYGARAAASINAIQGMPQQGQQQQGQPQQQPNQQQAQQQQMHQAQQRPQGPSIPRPQMTPSQYQQALAQQAAHQKQQLEQQAKARQQAAAQAQQQQGQGAPNGAQHAQTDGGADEDEDRHRHFGVIKQVGGDGSEINMGRVELDGLIRRQIEARGKAMEGGGLMLPLKQQKKRSAGGRRERKRGADVGQTDGGDDDDDDDDDKVLKAEDDDEDAINSDLDDPDDPKSDDSGDDETPQVMLCMYDKVQRVKNKWKCVMKDGVLTINGKDYVFHKASGEYEW